MNKSWLVLLMLLINTVLKGQSPDCKIVKGTFFYVEFDIRSKSSYPLIMAGINDSLSINSFSKEDVNSFISGFYRKMDYVPDLYAGYANMLKECIGKVAADQYIKAHPASVAQLTNNLANRGRNRKIILKSGETVFLRIVKMSGDFWQVNKDSKGISTTSNEMDIKEIPEINQCYVPYIIRSFSKPLDKEIN
ncbi:MAG TPA: hypothetical protein VM802_27755 [Chitinophaga sp.]|uniref:hypothetical protein n=1 Tax=Chitinophaga sp. TaxID=1869181 RepID=UPI002CF762B6|nr:hypothetical protein [Chitinophaga sp.]HVI48696.1 hypothetical protein [Chitinophaga sp.]